MVKSIIKIYLRLVRTNRTYSIINFFGLSLGLFVFILIYLYVSYELKYDHHHTKMDSIFRVYKEANSEYMGSNKFANTPAPLTEAIRQLIPEADFVTRILKSENLLVTIGKESFLENQFHAIDPDAFHIFTFELAAGSSKGILENPRSVVINETLARKYFGSPVNAIGKTINVQTFKELGEFTIESVIRDMPENSHVTMRIIFQWEAMVNATQPDDLTSWRNSNYYTYLTLKPNADTQSVEENLMKIMKQNFGEGDPLHYKLQRLSDVYLGPSVNFDLAPTGSMNRLYIFSCIGLLVLLIACINYTNMATARASNRAKEIGLRKVVGAKRRELMVQFIGEAVFTTILSMLVAYAAVVLFLPYFNSFLEKNITVNIHEQPILIPMLAVLAVIVGCVAGSYPAVLLSSLNPALTLKGVIRRNHGFYLRDVLVVTQFIISGTLIFATLVVWNQMRFVATKDLGFNRKQIITVRLRDKILREKAGVIKQQLLQNPRVIDVAASSRPPSLITANQGRTWPGKDGEKGLQVYYCEIDSSFLDLYEIKLLTGKKLSAKSHHNDVIVNESLVKELGYTNEEIVGTLFNHGDSSQVIGVVQDFHFQDLKQKIQPLRIRNFVWSPPSYLSVKAHEADIPETLHFIEETLNAISDTYPVEYAFYDELYARSYSSERKTAKMMGWFAGVAIFIATMGLYGLVLFMVNQRIREISIRKVLGASGFSIIRLISSHFAILILIGYVVACSIAYYAVQRWLNEFAYKVSVGVDIFTITLGVLVLITGSTIFLKVRHATSINPALTLKHE